MQDSYAASFFCRCLFSFQLFFNRIQQSFFYERIRRIVYLLSLSFFLPVQSQQYLINRYLLALKQVSLVAVILVFVCQLPHLFTMFFCGEQTQQFSIKRLLWSSPNNFFCFVGWSHELGGEGFWLKKKFLILAHPSQLTLKSVRPIILYFILLVTERSKNRGILINKMSPLFSPSTSQFILFSHDVTFVGVILDYCFVSFLVI